MLPKAAGSGASATERRLVGKAGFGRLHVPSQSMDPNTNRMPEMPEAENARQKHPTVGLRHISVMLLYNLSVPSPCSSSLHPKYIQVFLSIVPSASWLPQGPHFPVITWTAPTLRFEPPEPPNYMFILGYVGTYGKEGIDRYVLCDPVEDTVHVRSPLQTPRSEPLWIH